jgi:hypothetical protein
MTVDVEIRLVAVHALPNKVGHPSNREDISSAIQRKRVRRIEPPAGHNFVVDGREAWILGLKTMKFVRTRHCFDDIAGKSGSAIPNRSYLLTTTRSWTWEYSSSVRMCLVTSWWVLAYGRSAMIRSA